MSKDKRRRKASMQRRRERRETQVLKAFERAETFLRDYEHRREAARMVLESAMPGAELIAFGLDPVGAVLRAALLASKAKKDARS